MQIEERRFLQSQIRSEASSQKKILAGLAARFNHLSEDLGGFRERLAPGCFQASLASGKDIALLWNHDTGKPLARKSTGHLGLKETSDGLAFRAELNSDVSYARDAFAAVSRGDAKECSFGFRCEDEDWADEDDPDDRSRRARRIPVRTVKRANLHEISAVTFPAYANNATNVTASVDPSSFIGLGAQASLRNLFPGGTIPLEIRSRVPNFGIIDPAEAELLSRAREFLTRIAQQQ